MTHRHGEEEEEQAERGVPAWALPGIKGLSGTPA